MLEQRDRQTQKETSTTGTVLRIERGSVYDGDGFRTVVFLKGCPLRCLWCSTPESQSYAIEHTQTITYGQHLSVADVMAEIRKDSCCYFHSGGGLTVSGGEMLAQPDFARDLLKAAWEECINTAIETTFYAPWKVIDALLPYVDTAFVDVKLFSEERHKQFIGGDNRRIFDNLLRTNELEHPFRLIVRVPIIPGINDMTEELAGIGEFCSQLTHLQHIQLLPYHRLGTETYKRLGRTYPLPEVIPPSAEEMARCQAIVGNYVKTII